MPIDLQEMIGASGRRSVEPPVLTETQRVVGLPRITRRPRRFSSADFRRPGAPPLPDGSIPSLRPLQLQALSELAEWGALLADVPVGEGKTLISFLAAKALGRRRTVLMIPPGLRVKTASDYAEWRPYFDVCDDLRIFAYSELSGQHGARALSMHLQGCDPEDIVIIADEAHALKAMGSARTIRLVRLLRANPEIVFVPMSGTLCRRSLKDFAHLSELALGSLSPLPRSKDHLGIWAECIDVQGKPSPQQWRYIRPLVDWAGLSLQLPSGQSLVGKERRAVARQAFHTRFETAPAVISVKPTDVGASLHIEPAVVAAPPDVAAAVDAINAGVRPDGEEVYESDALRAVAARHACLGFYYYWHWPNVGRSTPDREWLEARRLWAKAVRDELDHDGEALPAECYDSPAWVMRAAKTGEAPSHVVNAWRRWEPIRGRYNVEDLREVRWIDTFAVDAALEWATTPSPGKRKPEPAIIWYQDRAVGDELQRRGIETFGEGSELRPPARTVAASIAVHGTGRNLQAWCRQAMIGCPANGETWEQLLGRTHRHGQKADEVFARIFFTGAPLLEAMKKAIDDARFVQATTGKRPKLLAATVSPAWPTPGDFRS